MFIKEEINPGTHIRKTKNGKCCVIRNRSKLAYLKCDNCGYEYTRT